MDQIIFEELEKLQVGYICGKLFEEINELMTTILPKEQNTGYKILFRSICVLFVSVTSLCFRKEKVKVSGHLFLCTLA